MKIKENGEEESLIKKIFSFMEKGKKLKTIKYNKFLQNKINVNIINYQIYSGRYIIFETKIKGKEYDGYTDDLLYEGEYLNGIKNGKGKEIKKVKISPGENSDYFNVIFEGEFLNGKKWNGKEYFFDKHHDESPDVCYEISYLNGKKNGKQKIFQNSKEYIEIEYINGKLWNKKEFDSEGNSKVLIENGKGGNEIELDLDLDFYGFCCGYEGEFLDGEKNGKGKEIYSFCTSEYIMYEGEYFNGKRHGKGIEYYEILLNPDSKPLGFRRDYKPCYIGGFLNGKRHGNGKLYDDHGHIFKAEYLYGKKWNIKKYDENSNIVCEIINGKGTLRLYFNKYTNSFIESEYLYGELNGKQKIYVNDKLIFEGEYINGELNGKVKIRDKFEGEYIDNHIKKGRYYINGKLEYEGDYLFGKKWNGKGYDENGNVIYELKNGNGTSREYNELPSVLSEDKEYIVFEGEYRNGKRNGKGKEYYDNDKLKFEGEYLNGKRNGKGKKYDKDGHIIFEGEYLKRKRWNGKKKKYYDGSLVFEGEYRNGKLNGKGKKYDGNGKLRFEGEYLNGEKTGEIKEYNYDGKLEFEGEYRNGKRSGKGKEYYGNGKLRFEGEYRNGEKWNGKGKEYEDGQLIFEGEYFNGEKFEKEK